MAAGLFANLRIDLAFHLLGNEPVGRFLDVGCGSGDFVALLARRGAAGVALDSSPHAVTATRARLAGCGSESVSVVQGEVADLAGPFDTVFTFEVLEHVADDVGFLRAIKNVLAPAGHVVLSTPAHARLWDATDEAGGHIRRYERDGLRAALESAGFTDVRIAALGVPVANLAKPVLALANRRATKRGADLGVEERTATSGVRKAIPLPDVVFRLLFNHLTLAPALWLQRAFARTDLGVHWVAVARRD